MSFRLTRKIRTSRGWVYQKKSKARHGSATRLCSPKSHDASVESKNDLVQQTRTKKLKYSSAEMTVGKQFSPKIKKRTETQEKADTYNSILFRSI